jgi:glycosyltransferase involved in cell wall biosynthesis
MKPKIVVIGLKGLPAFGGAATVGENIIEQLKDNYDFTVLSVASHTALKSGYIDDIKQIVFNRCTKSSFNTLIYYLRCLFHCLIHKYDLVHLHHAESGFIVPLLRLKYKIVVTFHGVGESRDPKFSYFHNMFFKISAKINVNYANEIVSVSQPDQDYVFQKYRKKIRYIPNGIKICSNNVINKKSKDSNNYILFAAGRIYQIKGLHLLLKAVSILNMSIKIKIAGDLDQVDVYKSEILMLSKELNVEFLGLIKKRYELYKLIGEANLFVFPSLTEAMSIMLLEVVSMKTPVIASDIQSNKVIFSDDELLYFKNNDANDLAEKIEYAIGHRDEMELMAFKAYEKIKYYYTWNAVGQQYKVIYNNLIER